MPDIPPLPVNAPDSRHPSSPFDRPPTASASGEDRRPATSTSCRNDLQHSFSDDGVAPSDDVTTTTVGDLHGDPVAHGAVMPPRAAVEVLKSPGRVTPKPSHPDAISPRSAVSPGRHVIRHTAARTDSSEGGPRRARDRAVLQAIVDCKYLSASQVQRYMMERRSITGARRALRRLESEGWVVAWEAWVASGGHTKYYLPRRRALAWALQRHQEAAARTPLERIATSLTPTTRRKPVQFAPRTMPLFFEHQCATNDIVLAFKQAGGNEVVWATAWDRPLPKRIGSFSPPQPDAILVLQRGDTRSLLFIETDRASEHAPAFQRSKSRYGGLKLRPNVLTDLFGIVPFHVLIVARCADEPKTTRRMADLARAARRGAFAELVTIRSFAEVIANPAAILDAELRRAVAGSVSTAHPATRGLDRAT
jgi:Replication-relaxation